MGPCRNQVGFFGCFFFGRESVVCLALGGGGGGTTTTTTHKSQRGHRTPPLVCPGSSGDDSSVNDKPLQTLCVGSLSLLVYLAKL